MVKNISLKKDEQTTLKAADFSEIFKENLSDYVKTKIGEYGFSYYDVTPEERDACIKKIMSTLLDDHLVRAGEHRIDDWEKGWSENLQKTTGSSILDISSAIPHYFGKHPFVRLNQKFVKPAATNFEYNMLRIILDWLFDKYMRDADSIYEFGCGTGHHLFRIRDINPYANLWGLDWAQSSQKIIRKFASANGDPKLFAHRFDYFHPDRDFVIAKDAIVYTIASLEQIGTEFHKFVSYLQKNKPKLCIHVEPIAELLDENNLLDYLSVEYFKKRNYLSGFLTHLRELENKGKVKILKAQRTHIGSLFIEGYSVIVWTPSV